jgi:hypothetical protein
MSVQSGGVLDLKLGLSGYVVPDKSVHGDVFFTILSYFAGVVLDLFQIHGGGNLIDLGLREIINGEGPSGLGMTLT